MSQIAESPHQLLGQWPPAELARELEPLTAGKRLEWLARHFPGRLVASTSFGLQAPVMLKLLELHAPQVPVIFIDTGFLFPETYRYAEILMERIPLNYRLYQPTVSAARMQALWGNLWEQGREGADRYALLTKVEPMNRALSEHGASVWLSGLRRSQSATRRMRPLVEQQKATLKVYPIIDWDDAQVDFFMTSHQLPQHPLAAHGYVTMGDWHSTRPAIGVDPERTRFHGEKYECGLHLESNSPDFQI